VEIVEEDIGNGADAGLASPNESVLVEWVAADGSVATLGL